MTKTRQQNLTDCHLHLQAFTDDLDAVLDRARAAGVSRYICNATQPSDWPAVKQLAATHPDMIPAFGLHPHFVTDQPENWLDRLEQYLTATPSAAVGEIGLDRHFTRETFQAQRTAFIAQLDLARKLDRPAMIHCLRADGPMIDILTDQPKQPRPILMHAYSASAEMLPRFARLAAYFSFGGAAIRQNAKNAHHALTAVPDDRLLIETDSPDMTPPKKYQSADIPNPDRNEPANLPHILTRIAEIRNTDPEKLTEQIARNTEKFLASLKP
ncbi:putative deoxyribonuclease YjjV [Anaerohalosphaera lusitana]|uniref:Putative deoxyribonuclease YjjV n=1 Tax=Anaerohalosphaera lusitana TaxID=1936003 RepID=A0A1U9NQU3_9BACT|nr:TatD family hydrolase [Anaerohalosphaera lusitana]AQT70302.1 putative deoxyribonuclease YjjV [Anaerohalosphaera lusitana]